jgi:hypothetical protein
LDALAIRTQAAEAGDQAALIQLAKAYTVYLSPMFHLIPWDDTLIIPEKRFTEAYDFVAKLTSNFTDVTVARLVDAMTKCPASLTVLRVIAGYRIQELAYALQFRTGAKVSDSTIKTIEALDRAPTGKQREQIKAIGKALFAAVEGTLLPRPVDRGDFIDRHDKFDTKQGWHDVATVLPRVSSGNFGSGSVWGLSRLFLVLCAQPADPPGP